MILCYALLLLQYDDEMTGSFRANSMQELDASSSQDAHQVGLTRCWEVKHLFHFLSCTYNASIVMMRIMFVSQ